MSAAAAQMPSLTSGLTPPHFNWPKTAAVLDAPDDLVGHDVEGYGSKHERRFQQRRTISTKTDLVGGWEYFFAPEEHWNEGLWNGQTSH